MAGNEILVFGGTGPSGICLLRELLFRKHNIIAYVRNPSKIPEVLASSPPIEIIQGKIADTPGLSSAIAKSSMIVFLLGPPSMRNHPPVAAWYSNIMTLMREHGVKRILAPCAGEANQEGDSFHFVAWIMVLIATVVFPELYTTARSTERVFVEEGEGVAWTVVRVGHLEGGVDEESWKMGREDDIYVGSVGDKKWRVGTGRAALAKWLVDCVEGGQDEWVGKLPAVSTTSGGKKMSV